MPIKQILKITAECKCPMCKGKTYTWTKGVVWHDMENLLKIIKGANRRFIARS